MVPDGKLRVIFCEVGQGDGVLISRGWWQMVVDTGPDNGKMLRCLDRHVPWMDHKIEVVMISHWDSDHSGAFEKIKKSYRIEQLIESIESGKDWEKEMRVEKVTAGEKLKFGELNWEIIYPVEPRGGENLDSLVAVMEYKGRRFLFAGDAPKEAEGEMLSWWKQPVGGLKVAHHGAAGSSSREWLERLKPEMAVISVGENKFGHPSAEVIDRLEKMGTRVMRTDKKGEIILSWK